jgi:hypothetical protein
LPILPKTNQLAAEIAICVHARTADAQWNDANADANADAYANAHAYVHADAHDSAASSTTTTSKSYTADAYT